MVNSLYYKNNATSKVREWQTCSSAAYSPILPNTMQNLATQCKQQRMRHTGKGLIVAMVDLFYSMMQKKLTFLTMVGIVYKLFISVSAYSMYTKVGHRYIISKRRKA